MTTLEIPAVNACRWCDLEPREHGQLWREPVGWHAWEPPSEGLRKLRLQQRRRADAIALLQRRAAERGATR